MPAKRKTNEATQAALGRLFAARAAWESGERMHWPPSGMEQTPGYTIHRRLPARLGTGGRAWDFRNPEPPVWVFRRQVRIGKTLRMRNTDPLVVALWRTLPERERRRSRLFAHCVECPVRFTKKGAIADALRHKCPSPRRRPTQKERMGAKVWASTGPPEFVPQDFEERAMVSVWDELTPQQRQTLYAIYRPPHGARAWVITGSPSPEAFTSRRRSAERALARALAARYLPENDYSLKTGGRRGFDYDRFWLRDWPDVEPVELGLA